MSGLKTLIIDENSSAIVNGRLQENLSLEWCDGQAQPLIEAGQSVPIFRNKIFSTADDYQESITLRLFIGNAPSIYRNHFVGELTVANIERRRRGIPQIDVEFSAVGANLSITLRYQPELTISFEPANRTVKQPSASAPVPPVRSGIREVRRFSCPVCERPVRLSYESSEETSVKCPHCSTTIETGRKLCPNDIPIESAMDEVALGAAMAELNALVGLASVKAEITELVSFISVQSRRRALGRKIPELSNHLIFTGNPGTGKTTVARLLAKIYSALGVCSESKLVETDRSNLVGEYVGHTAIKTKNVISSALGGVLFIDEAYSLVPPDSSNDFGREAIEVLLKEMEDKRSQFVVVVAGYLGDMERFIASNPGLESRFSRSILFEDYTPGEMTQIFSDLCRESEYRLQSGVALRVKRHFELNATDKTRSFANGRAARKLFEKVVRVHSARIGRIDHSVDGDLDLLTVEDTEASIR